MLTGAPPAGAGPESVTVAVEFWQPPTTVEGEKDRSNTPTIRVYSVALLFEGLKSVSASVAVAVSATSPGVGPAVTLIESAAVAPGASAPTLFVTTPPDSPAAPFEAALP